MTDERDNEKKDKERNDERLSQLERGKADGPKPDLSIWNIDHGIPDGKVENMEQRLHEDAKIMTETKYLDKDEWYPQNKENELSREDKLNVLSTLEKKLADSQGRDEMGIRLDNEKTGRHVNKDGEEICCLREKDLMSLETALPTYLEASREAYQQDVLTRPNVHSEIDADTLRTWQDSHKLEGGPTPSGDSLQADANKYKEEMVHAYINSQDVRDEQRKNR